MSDGVESALDKLVGELQQLRRDAGSPSYAEITLRVARQREARGVPAAEARPGRTTVYDVFRTGRRRIDTDLVAEIVRALGAEEEEVARWTRACREAQHPPARTRPDEQAERPAAPAAEDTPPALPGARVVVSLIAACVVLNLVGAALVTLLRLPIYLDMIGTAVSAIVLGPWWGALVGVLTNLGAVGTNGPESVPFALVNVAGALVWGYGVRRFGMGHTLPRFFTLNIVAAVVCTVVAVPIVLAYDGHTGHGGERITETFVALGQAFALAVLSSNLFTSLVDKVITGFVAMTIIAALPATTKRGLGQPFPTERLAQPLRGSPDQPEQRSAAIPNNPEQQMRRLRPA